MSQRTKVWIAQTMKTMMKSQSIDRIRITQLCKEAQIERPTFYYHFQDKYDLVAWIFTQSAFSTDILSVESATKGMTQMKEDFVFYKRAYEDKSQTPLWQYMLEYFVSRYTKEAKQRLNTDSLDTQLSYSIRFYCYGAVGMTKEWLLTDNITPAKTVVEMMFQSMPDSLHTIFFQNQ